MAERPHNGVGPRDLLLTVRDVSDDAMPLNQCAAVQCPIAFSRKVCGLLRCAMQMHTEPCVIFCAYVSFLFGSCLQALQKHEIIGKAVLLTRNYQQSRL